MTEPKVSIIIPVYNVERYLDRCLDSLRNQTLSDIEIILVDDSSPDGCPALCDKAASEDSRIKVIHKPNGGAGEARNAGLKIAAGKYIGFVDSDDYVQPDMYETLVDVAEKYGSDLVMSGVIFVGGNMFSEDGEREYRSHFDADTHFESADEIRQLRLGIIGARPEDSVDSKYGTSVWKNLFRRDIIVENGLYFESEREMLSEDALFLVDYIGCIHKATGISGAYYNYCRNGDSISKSYKKDRMEKGLVFIREAEKRLGKDVSPDEYRIYSDRFWQSFCRVLCSQEIMYATEHNIAYPELRERLKIICTHSKTREVLKRYPVFRLPLKQALFAFAVKYRLYVLQLMMVNLRSR